MQAKVDTLRAKSGEEEVLVYPKTLTKCVANENGELIEDIARSIAEEEITSHTDLALNTESNNPVANSAVAERIGKGVYSPSELEIPRKTVSSAGWYRIANFNYGTRNILVNLARNWGSASPEGYIFLVSWNGHGVPSIVQLNSTIYGSDKLLTKVRVVHKSAATDAALDVYFNANTSNDLHALIKHESIDSGAMNAFISRDFTAVSETVENGYTATEFELSSSPIKAIEIEGLYGATFRNDDSWARIINTYGLMLLRNITDLNNSETYTQILIGDGVANISKYVNGVAALSGEILHTGNSAKVVISETAPSDTSALWVW